MAEYKIYFKESVEKDFRAIPKKDLRKIIVRIQALANDPRPHGHEKLTGQERYRIRHGHYRIVYSVQDKEFTVWIVKVGHRKDIYR
ncbi:MAG: type II toxin-antitoxin system mRNA interferase toxin, RelE/StbE family [Deltaproteobacteria bacterium HGW-Deltaproteobacteria-12]|jgi:mRNA interferase RelE/StbE|nr:MAG: type II toxin-antitoxin system mRNA interferase toxin, RelE/StbE family [Deltaproteobacteria bacterium HGW-Deltaproteobacteria-12]